MNNYYLTKSTILYRSNLILFLALLVGIPNIYATSPQLKGKNTQEVLTSMAKILTPATPVDEPTNLLLVAGYLRFFAPFDLINEIRNLIGRYAQAINYYPYTRVDFKSRDSDLFKDNIPHYTQVNENICTRIFEGNIYVCNTTCSSNNDLIVVLPRDIFAKNDEDSILSITPLTEIPFRFALLILTKEGLLHYFVADECCAQYRHLILDDLAKYGAIENKISFCLACYASTFLVLVNQDTPILYFCQGINKDIGRREVGTRTFDTSDWYKNSQNNFDNLSFLGEDHFVILNHHPDLGSRFFFYYIHAKKPVGYLSFDKKYNSLLCFSCNTPNLCLYSQREPSMIAFDYTQQRFIPISLPTTLYPFISLWDTKQFIMGYTNNKENNSVHQNSKRKLCLCNLIGYQMVIQDDFQLEAEEKSREVIRSWHKERDNNLLLFCRQTKLRNDTSKEVCYHRQVFSLVSYKKDIKIFRKNFSTIKFG